MAESTKEKRVWHSGPPPHAGWWNASGRRDSRVWRWWDGADWKLPSKSDDEIERVIESANNLAVVKNIEWNDYWPEGARVPRLAPEDFEIGARWVCVDPALVWEFHGLEFTVVEVRDVGLRLDSYRGSLVLKFNALPSTRYVPQRCVGPQTRWDFPELKGVCHG